MTKTIPIDLVLQWAAPPRRAAQERHSSNGTPARKTPPIALLGVAFDHVNLGGALARIENMIASRRPHYVVTANVDFLVQARSDEELRRILLDAHLVLCDGTPLVWASRWLGNPLPERVAGADLVPLLLRRAAKRNYRLFFLGATPEVNAQAVANVRAQYPRINIVGNFAPPFRPLLEMDHAEITRQIRTVKPDVLFVSFGCPKAEKWIAMHYHSLGVPVVMGVGATIDFLAGHIKRAPRWMQRGGVEWIYRLFREPRRLFRRYATDLMRFAPAMAVQWWCLGFQGWVARHLGHGGHAGRVLTEPTWQRVAVPARLDAQAIQRDAALWDAIANDSRHCLLEMAAVQFMDSTGLGSLVDLHKRLRTAERRLILLDPSPAIQGALKRMRLEKYFLIAADAVEARELIESREEEQLRPVLTGYGGGSLLWRGEITAANADLVWESASDEIRSRGSCQKDWNLDLSGVRFLDSAGMTVMKRLQHYAPRKGARVHYLEASEPVRTALRRAGVERFLFAGSETGPAPAVVPGANQLKGRQGSEVFAPRRHERTVARVGDPSERRGMKIGISTSVIQRGQTGIAQYVFALTRQLQAAAAAHDVTLFVLEEDLPLFEFAKPGIHLMPVAERFRPPVKNILWHQMELPRLAHGLELDVLHVPSYRRMLWPRPCALVATIHDLAPFRVRRKYDWMRMFYGRALVPRLAQRQDQIIAVSRNTAQDIATFLKVPAGRVTVIPNGVDHERFHPGSREAARALVAGRFGLQRPFLLYVARLEHPAKNHVRLIEAFDRFKAASESEWQLVLGGSDWHGAENIHAAIQQARFARDIRCLGFVTDRDLPELYRAAEAFAYPSLYEGFGLPPVEAMACGCPVLCSTRGALGEVVGDAAATVNPEDVTALQFQLSRLATDEGLREHLRAAGLKRAREFDWKQTATRTLEVYAHAASRVKRPNAALDTASSPSSSLRCPAASRTRTRSGDAPGLFKRGLTW